MADKIWSVVVGNKKRIIRIAELGEAHGPMGRRPAGTVQPKAPGTIGAWVCIACEVQCNNNLEKDFHMYRPRSRTKASAFRAGGKNGSGDRADHVFAWYSAESGNVELP